MTITYQFAEFGTILADNPIAFPAGPYNAAGTLTLTPPDSYSLKSVEMRNGAYAEVEISGSYSSNGNAVWLNYTDKNIPPTNIAYILFTKNGQEGRGISLIPGMNKTYLLARE
jgi:hypothetical protein